MVSTSLFSPKTLRTNPLMNPNATLGGEANGKHWRIGIITESLIRFEWSDSGKFVDEPTQMAFNRDFTQDSEAAPDTSAEQSTTMPQFTAIERDGWLEIDTPHLHISYNQQPFTKEGLYATVKGVSAIDNTWHYGDEHTGLRQWARPARPRRKQHRRLGRA